MKQPTRIKTKYGITIPPWEPEERGRPVTLEFVLDGKIPAKKNQQRASFNYRWVFQQCRTFLKEHPETIPATAVVKFLWKTVKNIHPFIYKPPDIIQWEEEATAKIVKQAADWRKGFEARGLSFPITECSISIKYYLKDNVKRDNVNRDESIYDILVSAGIIADDNYTCLFKTQSEAKCYKDRITDHVALIFITAYKW